MSDFKVGDKVLHVGLGAVLDCVDVYDGDLLRVGIYDAEDGMHHEYDIWGAGGCVLFSGKNFIPSSCTRCDHYADMENRETKGCHAAICCKYKEWFPQPFYTKNNEPCWSSDDA